MKIENFISRDILGLCRIDQVIETKLLGFRSLFSAFQEFEKNFLILEKPFTWIG